MKTHTFTANSTFGIIEEIAKALNSDRGTGMKTSKINQIINEYSEVIKKMIILDLSETEMNRYLLYIDSCNLALQQRHERNILIPRYLLD